MATPNFICANWEPKRDECKKTGTSSCASCRLVVYCGPACQKTHWSRHKTDCKSAVGKSTWQPDWFWENREPAFVCTDGPMATQFGTSKYLWGNMPALDVLRLGSNEGDGYRGDLGLLFAASGDLRNVVKTLALLPSAYNHNIEVVINDRDLDIVARNLILLLIAMVVEDVEEAAECMIHVWYSCHIRESDLNILQYRVRPLVEDVCEKIKHKPLHMLLRKTWKFGTRALKVVMQKSSWDIVLSFFDVPAGLTDERAREIRAAINHAPSRVDYRHRFMCYLSPAHRIAFNQFREDGILLPFGTSRHDFQKLNPTFFQNADAWPMRDDASPLNGWSAQEIAGTSSGAATSDIYGKLFCYLRITFQSFLSRISSLDISFRLFQIDAVCLPDHLGGETFSRIEVSNISDAGYLGIKRTLQIAVPMLQSPIQNPHATLITLFLNAVHETMTVEETSLSMARNTPEARYLKEYLSADSPPSPALNSSAVKFISGWDLIRGYDHIFDRYAEMFKFSEVARLLGAAIKDRHAVTEKWPCRLKLRPGQSGAREEFDRRLEESPTGKERYVEWKRIH